MQVPVSESMIIDIYLVCTKSRVSGNRDAHHQVNLLLRPCVL